MSRFNFVLLSLFLVQGTVFSAVNPRFAFVGTGGTAFSQKFGLPYYALEGNYVPATGTVFSSVHPDNDPRPGFKVLRKVSKLNVRTDGLGQTNAQFQAAFEGHAQNLVAWYSVAGSRPPKPQFTWFAPNAAALAAAESLQIVSTIRREKLANPAITGTVWEIGNEPNFFPAILPAEYAAIYANYHRIIKREDSTARIAFGALFTRETGDDLKPMTRELIVAKLTQQGALALLGQPRFDSLVADIDSTLFSRLFNLGSAAYVSQAFAALPSNVRPDYISLHVYPFDDRAPVQTKADIQNRIDSLIAALAPITGSKPVWITEFGNVNPALSESAVAAATSDLIDVLTGNTGIGNIFYYKATGADQQLDLLSGLGAAAAGAPLTRLANDSAFSPVTGNFACSQLNAIGQMYYLRAVGATCQDIPPATAPVLLSPEQIAANVPTTTSLSWSSVIGAVSYHIQVATSPDFLNPIVNDTAHIGTARGITALSGGILYYWRVRARNGFGEGPWAQIFAFSTLYLPPEIPVQVSPAQFATGVSPGSVTLSWSQVSGATTYRVQMATDAAFGNMIVNDSNLATTTRALGLLAGSTDYFWRVGAAGTAGSSAWSSTSKFTTAALSVPATPVLILPAQAAAGLGASVTMVWNRTANTAFYHAQLSADGEFTTFIVNDSTLTDTLRVTGSVLLGATTYFWRVRGRNASGSGEWSSLRTFTTGSVSIAPGAKSQSLARIENGNTLRFRLTRADRVAVRILDLRGVTVAYLADDIRAAGDHRVTLPALPRDGVYLLDFRAGDAHEVIKLLP